MAGVEERARQPALLGEGDALRRQGDAVEKAKPRQHAGEVERLSPTVAGGAVQAHAPSRERAGEADRHRDLEQRLSLPEPVWPRAAAAEIGSELEGEIGAREDTDIDLVAELLQGERRR